MTVTLLIAGSSHRLVLGDNVWSNDEATLGLLPQAGSQRQTADEAPSAVSAVQEQGSLAPLRAAPATGRSMEVTSNQPSI